MVVPDANRFRRGACSKQSCGFSTLARSGTCCAKLSELQNRASSVSVMVATAKFCVAPLDAPVQQLHHASAVELYIVV
jgi:hypothetical protein